MNLTYPLSWTTLLPQEQLPAQDHEALHLRRDILALFTPKVKHSEWMSDMTKVFPALVQAEQVLQMPAHRLFGKPVLGNERSLR